MIKKICFIVLLALATASSVLAQEDEFESLGKVVVEKEVNLRRDPSTSHPRITLLAPSTELRLVDAEPVNGFYRVISDRGDLGWVWSKNVLVEQTQVPFIVELQAPCAQKLEDCPPSGCAAEDSPDGLINRTKIRAPSGTVPLALTFDDFNSLQAQANPLVNQGLPLTQEKRDLLKNLTVSSGQVSEGSLVKLRGFISVGQAPHKSSTPHPNRHESVNCRLTDPKDNDFHISIARKVVDNEFNGLVVEMIPQGRDAAWRLQTLKLVQDQGRRVLVVGALFYDNKHLVNADSAHPVGTNPKRFSLWEIHPITQFFVCMKASNDCSATSTSATAGWKRLNDL